jgi:DNA-directed RNA polymerase II subunit RPB3
MDITSNHLEVSNYQMNDFDNVGEGEAGDEPSKRGEYFGHPVGKSTFINPHFQSLNSSR